MDKHAVYRGTFAIGAALFVASTGLGLGYEIATRHRLPPLLPSPFEDVAAMLQRGEVDRVVAEYRTAAAISPHTAWSHEQLGFALQRAGDPQGALREFRAAARLDPESVTAHTQAAWLLLRAGDIPGAREHARRMQQIARTSGGAVDRRLLTRLGLLDAGS
jgi:tetratricopeptide (TPR) repeat protein